MAYYKNIMERAVKKQIKDGINYPTQNGSLYKFFRNLHIIALAFASCMSFSYIFGFCIAVSENPDYIAEMPNIIIIGCVSLVLLGTLFMLKYMKNAIVACFFGGLNFVGAFSLLYIFQDLMMNSMSVGGVENASMSVINDNFYWRHLIPLSLVGICAIGMMVIVLIGYFKTKKVYNQILEIVYDNYNKIPSDERPDWEEYVNDYKLWIK